jgi:SNF2 family DNA or RNA helicase
MLEKFGLEFRIVDSALVKQLRRERGLYANPWTHFPRLITSMDYLKREYPLRVFREAVAHANGQPGLRDFDILIVDEAHNVAPSGTGNYALDSQRTQALREIGDHFEHKLFLTATPHNGYKESFTALLELLDRQRFARTLDPDPAQLRAVMVRRLKSEIKDWDNTDKFPRRVLEHIPVDYTDEEKRTHALLAEYAKLRAAGYRDNPERFATEFVLKLLKSDCFRLRRRSSIPSTGTAPRSGSLRVMRTSPGLPARSRGSLTRPKRTSRTRTNSRKPRRKRWKQRPARSDRHPNPKTKS